MNRFLVALIGILSLVVPLLPAFCVPAIACALFIERPRDTATGIGITVTLVVLELVTGRMFGVLSFPFALVAGLMLFADRFVSISQGLVRSAIAASVMSFMMIGISVALMSGLYGRGMFLTRLSLALPAVSWWLVPSVCAATLAVCMHSWRGTENLPTV